jgi:7-cyano-7-deazaguanine synthase
MNKAIVLLSGGMDSAVTLYMAKQKYECTALIFDYGQKAGKEVECAIALSKTAGCGHEVMKISFPWKGSSLLDDTLALPENDRDEKKDKIPNTYVPGRNIIFLSYALSFAETMEAKAVFIGAHQLDYSNYPDCREDFFAAFRKVINTGTRCGVSGKALEIVTPILNYTKKQIVEKGTQLGVPFEYTWSCYRGEEKPCGVCESCVFRKKAFEEAGVKDPGEGTGIRGQSGIIF